MKVLRAHKKISSQNVGFLYTTVATGTYANISKWMSASVYRWLDELSDIWRIYWMVS